MSETSPTPTLPELSIYMKVALMEFTAAGPAAEVQQAFAYYLATVNAAFKASTDVAQAMVMTGGAKAAH